MNRQISNGADRADVYARITTQIIAAIEAGAGEFTMPWHHDGTATYRPANAATSRRYRGVNVLALWAAAENLGYASGLWATYRQWGELGAQVRRGEKATTVILWKQAGDGSPDNDEQEGSDKPRLFARSFSLFNLAQVDGYEPVEPPALPQSERISQGEAFIEALGIPIEIGDYHACYRISTDTICMPPFERFRDAVSHIGVLAHEAGHATGAAHRLDRKLGKAFGEQAVAMEELVAELTASYILADLGLAHHPRADHAAYLSSWLTVLNNDSRAIFTAASKAQQAADWMWARQPELRQIAA